MAIPLPGAPGESFLQGIDAGSTMFQRLMQNRLAQQQLDQRQKQFDEEMALKRAHEARMSQFGGLSPSGDVANALVVEQLRSTFGEQDPRYQQAKRALENQQQAREALMAYRGSLAEMAPFKSLSPLGKAIAEGRGKGPLQAILGQPQVGDDLAPVDSEVARAYERDIAKKTTDTDARKRYLFALNIDKTLDSINTDDLLRYSGIEGSGRFLRDQAIAATGKAPDELVGHMKAVESSSLLADQMRQFYGDSIQPQAMERLRALSNPATWYKNPKIAEAQFNQLVNILKQETETYKTAGTSTIKLDKPIIDYKDGEFVAVRPETNLKQANTKNNPQDETIDWDLDAVSQQLIPTIPEATPENIRHTAKETGKSIQEVIDYLLALQAQRQGGQ